MRNLVAVLILVLIPVLAGVAESPQQDKEMDLSWAFPVPDKTLPLGFEETVLKQVPGSKETYTEERIDPFNPPDWFPEEHPVEPPVVRHGSGKVVQACSYCHLATGLGHPQSGNLAGLSVAYLMRQLADFRSGARKAPPMDVFAKALPEDEAKQASEWFAALKPSVWVNVVETDTVPKTFVLNTRLRLPTPTDETEPLGNRIIEVPQDPSRVLSYDPHSGFIAYVPVGSIKKGEKLVTTGAGKTTACVTCHGDDLRGTGEVPRIAGRSAIYVVRQLYTFQNHTRNGTAADLMKPVVKKLTTDDMISIAAYVASRIP
jgi:cytochrome c553